MAAVPLLIEPYLRRWSLDADGAAIVTRSSVLMPVRRGAEPAMLKIAVEDEERRGAGAMLWWNGDGAARVLARDGDALLLERVEGPRSLAAMARGNGDDEASRILCEVAARLQAPRVGARPDLVPLETWFRALEPGAGQYGGMVREASAIARDLLAHPRELVVLHGDLHHGNVLDGGERGWLAIDPKGLAGERCFDFANLLRNPDAETALAPGRFARQLDVIAGAARVERTRLLQWTAAFAALSACWILADGDEADLDHAILELALAALRR